MALIKSTILAQISGSINGTTFAHNRGGAYARNRSLPSNPGTDRQDQVRTAMSSISTAWRDTLSDGERALWRNYGQNLSVINRLGDTISLSGIAAFNRVNLFRMSTLSEPMLTTPPPAGLNPDPAPTYGSIDITFPTGGPIIMDVNLVDAPASGYGLAVYYSGALSPGLSFYRGPYIDHLTEDITTNLTSINLTALGITSDLPGKKVAARITCYELTTGLPIWTVFVDPATIPAEI